MTAPSSTPLSAAPTGREPSAVRLFWPARSPRALLACGLLAIAGSTAVFQTGPAQASHGAALPLLVLGAAVARTGLFAAALIALRGKLSRLGGAGLGALVCGAVISALTVLGGDAPAGRGAAVACHAGALLLLAMDLGYALSAAKKREGPLRGWLDRAAVVGLVLGVMLDVLVALLPWLGAADGQTAAHLAQQAHLVPRLLRLAAMAAVAIPAMGLLSEQLLHTTGKDPALPAWRHGPTVRRAGYIVGSVLLPALLALAAVVPGVRWVLFLGADAAIVGVALTAWGLARSVRPTAALGWLAVLLSLVLGLGMGAYAFDGPMPAPEPLDAYMAPLRVAARTMHIAWVLTGLGAALLAHRGRTEGSRDVPRLLSMAGVLLVPLGALAAVATGIGALCGLSLVPTVLALAWPAGMPAPAADDGAPGDPGASTDSAVHGTDLPLPTL